MQNHRFQHLVEAGQVFPTPEPQLNPAGFVMCPPALAGLCPCPTSQFALYQHALEQAKAMAKPSIVELDLLGVWN